MRPILWGVTTNASPSSSSSAPADLVDVPTADEYRRVLPACVRASRTQKETQGRSIIQEMLRAHYDAPDHSLSATEMADRLDLARVSEANLRYNKFAKLLCEELDRKPKFNISILVTFKGEKWDSGEVPWTMRPEVVTALEELGWVKES
jgi:predicted HNH restriction endonuclease